MRSAALFLVLGFAAAQAPAARAFDLEKARAVFEAKCSLCHVLDRPLKKNKDRAGWDKTVARMKGYAGDRITDADAAAIVEYLARTRGPKP